MSRRLGEHVHVCSFPFRCLLGSNSESAKLILHNTEQVNIPARCPDNYIFNRMRDQGIKVMKKDETDTWQISS